MFMDAASMLEPSNKLYLKALDAFLWRPYVMDQPDSDVTTRSFLGRASQTIQATIITRQEGILAGMQEAEWFLRGLDLTLIESKKDGDLIQSGDQILRLEGRASTLLGAERTLLNLLQRMSGVATKTKRLSLKLNPQIKLLATRKTLWGLMDKRAVVVGGGGTHRLDLSDAILIKDNHIALVDNFKKSLKASLKKLEKVRFFEIELESVDQVHEFLEMYDEFQNLVADRKRVVVMLDNFKPAMITQVIKPLKEAGLTVELSGGINEKNITHYNLMGVDAISCGSITMSASHLDFSMQLEPSN